MNLPKPFERLRHAGEDLHFVNASCEKEFADISLIFALGWRDTYVDAVPREWTAANVTDDRWIPLLRHWYETGAATGLVLYRGDKAVGCVCYGPARSPDYPGWGELISFYCHPEERSKGYGKLLMEEALRRLKDAGFHNAYVLVLRENARARAFYARHGFSPDGTQEEIPFPPDAICVDVRCTRPL